MVKSKKQGCVWRSTKESRAAGKTSILAVAETVVCVSLYWALLLWLGVTWHHWIILIATPLVLFRSKRSIALGKKWFSGFVNPGVRSHSLKLACSVCLISALISGLAGWYLAVTWVVGASDWMLFARAMGVVWLSCNLGLGVTLAIHGPWGIMPSAQTGLSEAVVASAGAVSAAVAVTAVADGHEAAAGAAIAAVAVLCAAICVFLNQRFASETVSGVVAALGFALGITLRAFCVRLAATTRFLLIGVGQFPSNWRFATTTSDMFHPPELIPGSKRLVLDQRFLSVAYGFNFTDFVLLAVFTLIVFGPTMLWRWAIKSTAWFYLPLLWVRRGWQRLEGEDLQIWANSYSSKIINWVWLLLGGLSFAAVAIALFSVQKWLLLQQKLEEVGSPTTFIGFLSVLDWSELALQPWLWFYIPSYILTILIFFALDDIAKDVLKGAAPETRSARMVRWMWAANARAVLTNVGLAIALWYFLDAVDAWEKTKATIAGLV